ncbi:flagellar motor switch protein FliM [Rhodospirillum rubrum]|uniref:Flagellar motor switch protein FliM n=1 Tax=Rhodospirillum rubrum (strain ATCC 11170 / ATH 1.1.1 / DSM 467 / LMG 4362 / NCIMB 8255 / S1) TaxID=269796 RepID=Q2RQF8_RHORT|nr:flagellar motor switch protein FliM [Rhodospirillum rubrum]ABC23637.1 flagellar motor switch protein FliM [Rhodospirillum rubrum ATCC 11170]AEO49375.1 flagellar motor switch protein FliM [Rhodospirillum rubrum F11]MBK5955313.1 flagellar motor switch protein FliM [Rhodospirillum rubrum]QXG79597.1 flagellar motor switch protein FliM [Rhodospirillum rubrum]
MVPADDDPKKEVSPDDEKAMMAEWESMVGGEDEPAADGDEAGGAAEWETMLADEGGEGEGGMTGSARVLNQDEIDSLLGFSEAEDSGTDKSGIQAIISTALVSYERLPMLEVVFDRLVRMMSTSLRNFTSDNVEVSLDNIQSYRFGDYLNSIPLPAMLSVFKAEEWDNYGLLTIDSSMIYSIVDVLLGGRRGTAAMRIEGRPYTTIERNLVERLVHVVLADLSAAFDPLSPVTFRFDRLETNPRFATISRPSNAAIVAKLRIDMEDRGGRLDMLIPYATLEPVRELLLQMFMGEKFGRDSIWETHLAEEMWSTEVQMDAILDEVYMPLNKILSMEVGSQILFNATPDSTVQLRCGDVPMFDGKMGRKGQNIAIRVDSKHNRAKS